jgi:energy-coupling factor transporter ATP-binding protein EcfA2
VGANADALTDINLRIPDGDFVGIIGPSGAGKTTLTRAINGLVPHHYKGDYYGEVLVDGKDTLKHTPDQLAVSVGSVFQDIESQLVSEIVEDEVLFGLENFSVSSGEIESQMEWALNAAGIPGLRNREIRSLSGGQKQKVAIASIIALRPKIIVLDEPTGELDPLASRRIFETLRELNTQFGVTVVVVEQKIMLLCEFARRLAVLSSVGLAIEGSVTDVLRHIDVLEATGVNIPRVATLAGLLRKKSLFFGEPPINVLGAKAMIENCLRGENTCLD